MNGPKKRIFIFLLTGLGIVAGCKQIKVIESDTIPEIEKTRDAEILTAFYGLDNGLPLKAVFFISRKAYKKDGMPVVFSQEIDPETLDASDFEITTQDGSTHVPDDVSLLPANEAFELRTVLVIGEYGSVENPPISVKITGDLKSRSGKNFKGAEKAIIPLEEGPVLSYAEYFTFTEDYPYVEKGRGCDCPRDETEMVVTVVWSGGVRALDGEELGANELDDFKVTMVSDSDTMVVNPYKLADLKDNDNNIDLCLKEAGTPILVQVSENIAIDPNDDKNPKTEIQVVSRW